MLNVSLKSFCISIAPPYIEWYWSFLTTYYIKTRQNIMNCNNQYIINWILHQIFMYSNKVILAAGYKYVTLHPLSLPYPFPFYWRIKLTSELKTNFLSQYISF